MKFPVLIFFIGSFCYAGPKDRTDLNFSSPAVRHDTVINKKETIAWIDDFKLLRTAVYQNDRAAVKQYFKFPLYNKGNDIWWLVLSEKEYDKIPGDKKNAFLAKDLDKYYSKIFTKAFVKCILKVKADELWKKGYAETPEFTDGKTTYKMIVTYDKKMSNLSINLNSKTVYKDKDGEVLDGGEGSVIYNFIIDKTGHIFFKELMLAG